MSRFASIISAKREAIEEEEASNRGEVIKTSVEPQPLINGAVDGGSDDSPLEPEVAVMLPKSAPKKKSLPRAASAATARLPREKTQPSARVNPVAGLITNDSRNRQQSSETPGGKKVGKRSDPDYTQITAWIRKQTHHDVKIALLREGQGREFSEVVEDLLTEWLRTNT